MTTDNPFGLTDEELAQAEFLSGLMAMMAALRAALDFRMRMTRLQHGAGQSDADIIRLKEAVLGFGLADRRFCLHPESVTEPGWRITCPSCGAESVNLYGRPHLEPSLVRTERTPE